MFWLILLLLTASDPWNEGRVAQAWRELEARPRDFASFLLRTSYLRQEPSLALESLRQAELLAKTPRERCLVLLEKLELAARSERPALYEEAVRAYQGFEDPALEARLAEAGASVAVEPGVAVVLWTAAARDWERLGRASEASRAWVGLASFQVGRGQPEAARAALRKAIATRAWLPILRFARTPRDWPELARDWERLAPSGPRGVEHLVAVADLLRAHGRVDEARQVVARAALRARGDPWLELPVARQQFALAPDFEGRQAIYARALAASARLPRGQAAPWSAPRASTWEFWMAAACEADARLAEGLSHARRAFEGEPRNLVYLGRILELQVAAFQAGPARTTAAELRRRILALPSGAERLSDFSRLRNVLTAASHATRDEMGRSDHLPGLAGELQAEMLADQALMERVLRDLDDAIQTDREGTRSLDKARLLALLDRAEEAEGELVRGLAALPGERWRGNLTEALARVYRQLGQPDKAEEALRRAAHLYAAVEKWVEAAQAWDALGRLLRERGRPSEAVVAARQAVELARKPVGVRFHLAAGLSGLGRALWEAGSFREAAAAFAEAAVLETPAMSQVALQARALRSAGDPQAVVLMASVCRRQLAREEWAELPANALTLARWTGELGPLEEVARELVRFRQEAPGMTADDRELLEWLASALIKSGREAEAAGWLEARTQLERPVAGLEQAQGELAALRRGGQRERLQEERQRFLTRLEGLRERYPEYERLARLRPSDLAPLASEDAFVLQLFAAPDGVYLLGVDGERRLSHFVPVARPVLEATVREYLADVSERHLVRSPAGERLEGWLLDPWRDRWKGKKLVLLPSGILSRVPWEVDVVHAFSSQLARVAPPSARFVVGMGGLSSLPGTVQELGLVRSLFPSGVFVAGSRAEVDQWAGQADVLHVATHAEPGFLELADGRLLLRDVLGLGLKPGSLVVLSACETGRASFEGDLNSLAAAFRAAGASSVIASLWPVDDEVTAELFGAFYRELRTGVPASEALGRAKRSVRSRWPAPYYWAGFQFLGQEW